MRKIICIALVLLLLLSSGAVSAEQKYNWGDLDGNGAVNATDALLVLQHAVGKTALTKEALAVANVSATGTIDALDALLILQYAVDKLERFPAEKMSTEEMYYASLDSYYGVDGSDFKDVSITDFENADEVLAALSELPSDSDIDGYALNSEGNIVYDRISREAKKQGMLSLYNTAKKIAGEITLRDGTQLTYQVPTDVTAYSAVPLKYSVKGGDNAGLLHVIATTYEEPDRVPANLDVYYENTMPDQVDILLEYNGYVQAEDLDGNRNSYWNAVPSKDKMGTQYPPYTPSELTYSGTIPAGNETWLKFTATNTGNTILKGDGQGYFNFRPKLYKKNADGDYDYVAMNDNYAYRLYDPLYPGESMEFWVKFGNGGYSSYSDGEYKVEITGELANEQASPAWAAMYVGGRTVTRSEFLLTASANATVTTPNAVTTTKVGAIVRNSWLGVYEEFQTSYHTHYRINTQQAESDTLYFQPAPWDKTLTLRVISDDTGAMDMVTIPLHVESDSLSITLNPYNNHYVVKEDGTREPILGTQNMADMRGNNQDSPYAMDVMVNDLKDMQEAGINYFTSTMAFTYTVGSGNLANIANRVMMDFASILGIKVEGYGTYPYENSIGYGNITRPYAGVSTSVGTNKMNGILNSWVYERFGDTFWSNPEGITPIAQEDSRGWMTIDHDWRMDLDDDMVEALQKWLEDGYGTIAKLNQAYGSEYASFADIDPRVDGTLDNNHYNFTNTSEFSVYHEKSQAIRDLDLFRTVNRVQDYEESLMVTSVENAKMIARYEGSPLITVGLNPNTKNAHYRETYYQMYRAGLVGEVLAAATDTIYGTSTYINTPYTPSETYELTKHAQQNGINVMNYHMGYRDQIYNTFYGDGKADVNLHLADSEMKVTAINTASALFPAFKATYEAGGAPGIMWMDYYCNGFVTSTKYKELQFYTSKIKEMLATDEGKAWATDFDAAGSLANQNAGHVWSYDPEYLLAAYNNTPRRDKFNLTR